MDHFFILGYKMAPKAPTQSRSEGGGNILPPVIYHLKIWKIFGKSDKIPCYL